MFYQLGLAGYWWSATESDADSAWRAQLYSDDVDLNRLGYSKTRGYSVRCVKD